LEWNHATTTYRAIHTPGKVDLCHGLEVNMDKLALAPVKLYVSGLQQIAVSWTPYCCL